MNYFKKFFKSLFVYSKPKETYNFILSDSQDTSNNENDIYKDSIDCLPNSNIFDDISKNLDYIKVKYNSLINSDIILREFTLKANNKKYKAFLVFIDGMVDSDSINNFTLRPLMKQKKSSSVSLKNVYKKFNLKDYIFSSLTPQNSMIEVTNFEDLSTNINSGCCALIVDTLSSAFIIDVKGYDTRSISQPNNEFVIRGSQEAFVEKLRTNTSMIRRIVNNSDLVIEKSTVGNISKTSIAICYMKSIANNDLVSEVKYRINNIDIDYITSSGQLEQLIQDNSLIAFPQVLATERADKASHYILDGRVVVIVNGSPYVLIMPGTFIDFIASPEDLNLKFQFSNLLKFIRLLAVIITLLLPGFYIAVTNYHIELLPTELLFTIAASRNSVPFPVIFETLLMEVSFELIRESGIRVPNHLGSTIGIVGALILR